VHELGDVDYRHCRVVAGFVCVGVRGVVFLVQEVNAWEGDVAVWDSLLGGVVALGVVLYAPGTLEDPRGPDVVEGEVEGHCGWAED